MSDKLAALHNYKQFIIYELVTVSGREKKDKVPICPLTFNKLKWGQPENWLDYQSARNYAGLLGKNYGVGFILTDKDPFFLLDIDKCMKPDNSGWSDLAVNLCELFNGAAVEISSSGKALHIIGSVSKIPEHVNKNIALDLELYFSKRFIALTETSVIGSAGFNCDGPIQSAASLYFSVKNETGYNAKKLWKDPNNSGPAPQWKGPTDNNELIKLALNSCPKSAMLGVGLRFSDLWDNNTAKLSEKYHNDKSSYDMALALNLAFWTGNDKDRIYDLMMQSGLYREKYERHDYLKKTILEACAKQNKFYYSAKYDAEKNSKSSATASSVAANPVNSLPAEKNKIFYTIEDQKELFNGCVYICDLHKVLLPSGMLVKPDQFRAHFGNRVFCLDENNQKVCKNAWQAFIESAGFNAPRAESACFKPGEPLGKIFIIEGRTCANTFKEIPVELISGDATPFTNHLRKLFVTDNDYNYMLGYLAACVQQKGQKYQWAPVIQGTEGNGKSIISQCLANAVGRKYFLEMRAIDLLNKFNSSVAGALLVNVEDFYLKEKTEAAIEIIKPMITNSWQPLEGKNDNLVNGEVCYNFIINSNHKDALKKTKDNRRFAPFYTPQQCVEDLKKWDMTAQYFTDLWNWLKNQNGFAIVAHFLQNYKIEDKFNPAFHARAPVTSTTDQAISFGRGKIEQEILECAENDTHGFKNDWLSTFALDKLLERLRLAHIITHIKRAEILKELGYIKHPGLNDGRVNRRLDSEGGGKPRLYVTADHYSINIEGPQQIVEAYLRDQAS